jgi:hypothetical protein
MLYDPRIDCKPKKLQIAKTATNSLGHRVNLSTQIFETHSQDFEYVDMPIYIMLGRFGKVLPDQRDTTPQGNSNSGLSSGWIVTPYVCYQTLRKVCRIEIEWVDSVAMHLELDGSRRALKIFRFPSFCRIMYRRRQRGLLSQ